MVSSGSNSRKKKATRRQIVSLAGSATLALGTLGMMTFGVAGTAYAQSSASKQLSAEVTIGSVSTAAASATINQSNPQVGATDNNLSITLDAANTVTISTSDQTALTVTESSPVWSAYSSGVVNSTAAVTGEVYDATTGQLFELSPLATTTDAITADITPANGTAETIASGDTLEFEFFNLTNSPRPGSADLALSVDGISLGTTAPSSITNPTALELSDSTNPGQETTLSFTYLSASGLTSSTSMMTVGLTENGVDIQSADILAQDASLTVNGTVVSGLTFTGATGSIMFSGAEAGSGTYVLSVPVENFGPAQIVASYNATHEVNGLTVNGTPVSYGPETSSTTWALPEEVTAVTASNPYANATSTVSVDFVNLASGTTPITVSGLGLSSDSATVVGQLQDTTTGVNDGYFGLGNGSNQTAAVTLASGDAYVLTLESVPLPSTSVSVSVSTDYANPGTGQLTLGTAATSGMVVSPSTTGVGASATWTYSNVELATSLASGSTLSLTASGDGNYAFLPLQSSDYMITDVTNSADSQTPSVSVSNGYGRYAGGWAPDRTECGVTAGHGERFNRDGEW